MLTRKLGSVVANMSYGIAYTCIVGCTCGGGWQNSTRAGGISLVVHSNSACLAKTYFVRIKFYPVKHCSRVSDQYSADMYCRTQFLTELWITVGDLPSQKSVLLPSSTCFLPFGSLPDWGTRLFLARIKWKTQKRHCGGPLSGTFSWCSWLYLL